MINKIIIKNFSLMLYNAIKDSGFSYREIAKKIVLSSKREIYNYVNGEKWPSPERLLKIIYLLKIDVSQLFIDINLKEVIHD